MSRTVTRLKRRLAPIVAAVVMIFGIPALALSTASPAAAVNNNQFGWPATGHTDAGEIAWHQANERGAQAVDIQAPVGTSVYAAQSGVVVTASTGCANSNSWGCGHGFGNYVVIRHHRDGVANPLYTLYAHLNSNLSVSTGQGVSFGTKLGVIALSGSTTGGHTHFAIGTCATPWYTGSGTCTIWNGADTSSATVNQGSATPGTYSQLLDQNTDTDGDGVSNGSDQCPSQAGPASNNGCPVTDSDGDGVVNASDACTLMPGATSNRGCRMDGHTVKGNFTGDNKTDAVTFYDYGSSNLGAFLETGSSAGLSKPSILWTTGTGQWNWGSSYFVAGNFAGNDSWTDVIGFYDYGNSKLGAFLFQGNGNGVSQAVHLWTTTDNAWGMGSAKYVVGNFSGNDNQDDILAFYGYSGNNMSVFVFPGNGNGVAQNVGQWTTGPNAWNVKSAEFLAGDFAGNDGYTDVMAMYDYGSGNLGMFLFQGSSGNLGQPQGQWTTGNNAWNVKSGEYGVGDYNHDGKDDIVALYDLTNSNLGAFIFPGNGNGVDVNQLLWTTGTGQWNLSATKMVAGDFGSGPSLFTFYNYGGSNTGGALLPSTSAGFGQPQGGWSTGAGQWNWLCM